MTKPELSPPIDCSPKCRTVRPPRKYFPKFVEKHGQVFLSASGAVLLVALAGCDGQSMSDSSGACDNEECDKARVEDCDRRAPDATPLAVIHDDIARFVLNDGAIYFVSDQRFFRLPVAAGPAEAITEPAADGAEPGAFDVAFGTIAWLDGRVLRATSTDGDEIRTLATMPEDQGVVVVTRDRVVTSGRVGDAAHPAGAYSVPLGGGVPKKIVNSWATYGAARDDATGRVFFATTTGLFAIDPQTGEKARWTKDEAGFAPAIAGGAVFAGGLADIASLAQNMTYDGVQAILAVASPSQRKQLARGIFVSIAADVDGLAFDGALGDPQPGHASIGYVPITGDAILLGESDSELVKGPEASVMSRSLASDGTFVYWPSVCLDADTDTDAKAPREFRLVRKATPP